MHWNESGGADEGLQKHLSMRMQAACAILAQHLRRPSGGSTGLVSGCVMGRWIWHSLCFRDREDSCGGDQTQAALATDAGKADVSRWIWWQPAASSVAFAQQQAFRVLKYSWPTASFPLSAGSALADDFSGSAQACMTGGLTRMKRTDLGNVLPVSEGGGNISRRALLVGVGALGVDRAFGAGLAGDPPGYQHADYPPKHAGALDDE
jgi:hypothetical protein